MQYDFVTRPERQGMDALAVDAIGQMDWAPKEGFSAIPMWVADMNFNAFPGITESMTRRL